MALMKKNLDSQVPIDVPVVNEIQEPRNSTFTALVPSSRSDRLLRYVEGKPWTVNYYGQLLNTHSTVRHYDIEEGNLSQSYEEILDLVLKVQSELSYTYDNEEGESQLTGSALIPFKVTPTAGDVFVANIDTGEDAIFRVTSVSRLTHRKDTIYEIDYSLLSYVNDDPEIMDKLKKRINETYYYDNYMDSRNRNYLLTTEEKHQIDELRAFMYDSQVYYFKTFSQPYTGTLGVPGTPWMGYDPILNDLVFKLINFSTLNVDSTYMVSVERKPYDNDTIVDCLLNRTLPKKRRMERRAGYVRSDLFFKRMFSRTGQYLGIEYFLCPVDADISMISKIDIPNIGEESLEDPRNDKNYDINLDYYVPVTGTSGESFKPILGSLFEDNYYIVSKHFYNYLEDNSLYEDISYFELMVYRFLNRDKLAVEDLFKLINGWHEWSWLHQFYYLPVIWLMVKHTINEV